ncbi:MAG: transglycosylase SLT domain-containing protein [Bacteroidaceae bacterium]|nr:transglycosylase SLT domain-containing protein [Bacteroidaceae bacterium]
MKGVPLDYDTSYPSATAHRTRGVRCMLCFFLTLFLVACNSNSSQEGQVRQSPYAPDASKGNPHFDLPDIQQNGELIVLTLYGPESYFEFRGEDFGLQFMIVRQYAKSIGASIRVDVSRNQKDLYEKIMNGEGDIIACQLNRNDSLMAQLDFVGEKEIITFMDSLSRQRKDDSLRPRQHAAWAVRKDSPLLSASLAQWMTTHQKDFFAYTTIRIQSAGGRTYTPRRKVASPILNASRGEISLYDGIFKRQALKCGWDWRLLAAQAYQESAFDPQAVSYMGAMGLMQLMPGTAREVGVAQADVFDPQSNVQGAVKYINKLNTHYATIADANERINFILAGYNAGAGHVDDARALARKYGKNPDVWLGNVDVFVLRMSQKEYYNQPEVRHGYFRGSETYDYVNSIRTRWSEYKKTINK